MTLENWSTGFPTRSDTNRPVQSKMKVRLLKFWVEVEEELYYPSSENKGADQLCSYCTADLRLSFSHRQKSGSYNSISLYCSYINPETIPHHI